VSVVDEHTRECLGGLVDRSITGDDLIDELHRLAAQRGYPAVLRCDNAPHWPTPRWPIGPVNGSACTSSRLASRGATATSRRSTAGSATNANINIFWSVAQARVLITDWKEDYNHRRRHSALGYQAPAQYAVSCLHR